MVFRRYNPPCYRQSPIELYLEAYLEPAQAFKMMLYEENVNDIKMLTFSSGKMSILSVWCLKSYILDIFIGIKNMLLT